VTRFQHEIAGGIGAVPTGLAGAPRGVLSTKDTELYATGGTDLVRFGLG
jgi:hypothetical protein